MDEFYRILGVQNTATDDEIKRAYIKLKRKYDPQNYEKETLKKHALEKTNEITKAFDTIMNERRSKRIENNNNNQFKENFDNNDIEVAEDYIKSGEMQKAEHILSNVKQENRNAKWYYLKGIILFKKGWLLEATNFFEMAVQLDPTNEEYKNALERAKWQRGGGFNRPPQGGMFNEQYPNGEPIGCGFCDVCGTIMCADMCCECTTPRGYGRCC